MPRFERAHVTALLERLKGAPHRLIIITGPRQVGKTTIVQQARDRCPRPMLYVPADEPMPLGVSTRDKRCLESAVTPLETMGWPLGGSGREWLLQVWKEARDVARSEPTGAVLVIDEIQKIENWSELVKGLWDQDRRDGLLLHVVLLGLSPLSLQKGLTKNLAGRFERIRVPHWSFSEMSQAFSLDIDQYLYYGGYPGAMRFRTTEDRWRAYVLDSIIEPIIGRDIVALDRVERPDLLRRLFEVAAEYSGQIFTLRGMLQTLAESSHPKTIADYLDRLENAGLIANLRGYARDSGRRIDSHPKLNVLNTALMTAVSGYTFDDTKNDRTFRGRLVESAVGAHLYNTGTPVIRLHYWRDRGRREVNFVLERGPHLVGCEVKTGPRPRPQLGLREFQQRFPSARSLVVGEGGVPLVEFLSTPALEWLAVS